MSKRIVGYFTFPLLLLLALPPRVSSAQSAPETSVPGPDVIMGNLPTLIQAGSNGTQVGLMMGTDICNNGNVQVNWFRLPETDHPVIPQNLYRMSGGANNDDRFEQIGQSWAMHQFFPLQNNACLFGCTPSPDSAHLGVGCSTADSASINASQAIVGSRAWVNPFTGIFPSTSNSHTGHTHDGTTHRILVEGNDLNTMTNQGATYYGEAQLVTPHEYAWCQGHAGECNMFNNVSYRQFAVTGTTTFSFAAVGPTVRMTPAIFAWPGATIQTIEPAPGVDGRAFIAYKVSNPSVGIWQYEYAIYNQNLDRGIQSFSVAGGCGFGPPTNLEFHAPLNHPGIGEDGTAGNAGYSNAPWTAQTSSAGATWFTETFAQNPNANALRWGTLYNFRFQHTTPPTMVNATIGFYKTGTPIIVPILGPASECFPSPSPSPTVIVDPPTPTPGATPTPTPTATPTATGTPPPSPTPAPCDKFVVENFDSVTAPALPPGWSSADWVTSTIDPDTPPNDAYVNAPAFVSDRSLESPFLVIISASATLAFRNNYNLESGGGEFFDGGVLEISSPNINGGAFTDIIDPAVGGSFIAGGYTGKIGSDFGNPLAGRQAWSGNSGGYIHTVLNLGPNVNGQTIQLRFRMGSDSGGSSTGGWRIDTMSFTGVCTTFPPGPSPTPTPTATATATATPPSTPTPTPTPGACGWTLGPPLPIPLYGEAVTSLGGNLYSFGGRTTSGQMVNSYKFDGTAWTVIAPLPVPLSYAAAVSDGRYAYILGGADSSGESTRNLYRYDPLTNTYAALAPFVRKVQSHTAVYRGGKIYKYCGYSESKLNASELEIYDILSNTWTFGASCPIVASGVAGFTDGNYIYAAGGLYLQPVVFSTRKTHRYDPASNTWNDAAIADLPVGRENAVGAFYNGGGLVAGGVSDNSPPLASVLRWNPASNTWSNLPDMLGGRSDTSGTVLNDGFYIVGGFFGTPRFELQKLTCPAAPTPSPAPQALNFSTRMRVLTGDGVGIGGFIIAGSAPKHVLIRGIGPSLTAFGVPDALADPRLELHGPAGFVTVTNNNWRDTQEAEIQATGIPPTNNLESAIISFLAPGAYTAILRGNGNTTGIALVEVYDLSQGSNFRLANISTRAVIGTGDNIVIAGFVLGGSTGVDRIVVRGLGPSMTAFGIPNPVADPTLELRDNNGAILMANNDWQDNAAQAAELTAAGLAPFNDREAAIAVTLAPGLYTALLAGRNNGTGPGLVEVYDRGPP